MSDLVPQPQAAPVGLPNASPTVGSIATALAKAQASFGKVVKDKKAQVKHKNGGSHSYNYATLTGVLEAVSDALTSNGIVCLQPATATERAVRVHTVLVHGESGEWIADYGLAMPVNGHDPQAVGSAITYARRYGLTSLLGISQDDDDGSTAARTVPAPLNAEQQENLRSLSERAGIPVASAERRIQGLRADGYQDAVAALQQRITERQRDNNSSGALTLQAQGSAA